MTVHVLSVLVEDKPGVLARVASMFARRGFNIHSLAVGPAAEPGNSLMTVVVDAAEIEQVVKQLRKLINTIKITELNPDESVERELMLVRVSADASKRGELLDSAAVFKAKAVDVGTTSITFEMSGSPAKVNDFLELVRPYGLIDVVKSGWIALSRDSKSRNLRAIG
ncbi:MAG: acetolactate synthase small subunit [Acidimicrobiia bacterium]|nr:acetolactate synthase small subunit [Acidimicrobiia bacterium]NNF09016.1 acetolactate synthase small subunit [Acidimicrobiia bacterium]NNL69013.1 acetolactate synthase small subunit [Acidimicrobiia bacterium]